MSKEDRSGGGQPDAFRGADVAGFEAHPTKMVRPSRNSALITLHHLAARARGQLLPDTRLGCVDPRPVGGRRRPTGTP